MIGAVTRIDSGNLTLKPDAGGEVTITLLPGVSFRRVAPGETNLQKATTIGVTDIHAGDRVLARGTAPGQAALVVVISQSDITQKQAADRADWEKRGVSGTVAAVSTDTLTLRARTLTGDTQIVLSLGANGVVRRYAPDSIRFADAIPAKWAEIRVGDQVRARGERTSVGVVAEEVVAGTFRTIAAVVGGSGNAGDLQITELESKKKITLKLTADTSLRRLSPQTAQVIAARVRPELAGKGKNDGKAAPDFAQMVERSPAIKVADLQSGDALVISIIAGASADRMTAISVIAGVEPILTKPGTQEMSLGSWDINLGGGLGAP